MTSLVPFIRASPAIRNLRTGTRSSPAGTPEPEVILRASPGASHRHVDAMLHAIAAELLLRTATGEGWVIRVEPWAEGGRVYLELATGSEMESARAMTLLREVFG